jgi:alkyl sulfatase BDS1-like metallo-beta-lactamase superfamily hydrolase
MWWPSCRWKKFLQFLAIRVNGPRAQALRLRIDWLLPDGESQRITLSNGALNHRAGRHGAEAEVTVRTDRSQLARLLQSPEDMLRCLDQGEIDVQGARDRLREFVLCLDAFTPMFNVVEPDARPLHRPASHFVGTMVVLSTGPGLAGSGLGPEHGS